MQRCELDVANGQVRNIRLYGKLGARFGRVHRMAVGSAAEAVSALGSQLRGFEAYLTSSKDRGEGYAVFYDKRNLSKEQLHDPAGSNADIRIAPITLGSKNGGIFQIVLGAILVIVGTVGTVFSAGTSAVFVSVGWGMIVGGVVQLLTPVPKGLSSKDKADNQPNYAFNGPVNTQAQGAAKTCVYGELIVGSAVVSAGIDVGMDQYVPSSHTPAGSGGGGGGAAVRWNDEWQPAGA